MHFHAVVWIDHHEARGIVFDHDATNETKVHPEHPVHHLHSKAGSPDGARAAEDTTFYKEISDTLKHVRAFLVVGPANAKTEFAKYLREHAPIEAKILAGVEPMDRASDGELLAFARHYFKKADWKLPPQTD